MPAAIRPYSIAVAPDSSDKNFKKQYFKPTSWVVWSNPANLWAPHLRLCKYDLLTFRRNSFLDVSQSVARSLWSGAVRERLIAHLTYKRAATDICSDGFSEPPP
jgi:hypothetical protein